MSHSGNDIVPAVITEDVQARLNTLNHSGTLINKMEIQLEQARSDYKNLLSEATEKITGQYKRFKYSIEKARPYYELDAKYQGFLRDIQLNSEAYSVLQTEHDNTADAVKAYNINIAQFRECDTSELDEVNEAVQKINVSKQKIRCLQLEHKNMLDQCSALMNTMRAYRSRFSSSIKKSKPYFDLQTWYNQRMEESKHHVESLTKSVREHKALYTQTMNGLEAISERIHESRRLGEWLRSPLSERRCPLGADDDEDGAVQALPRLLPSIASSPSLLSSPRQTPPGQVDTDTEDPESEDHRSEDNRYSRKSTDIAMHFSKGLIEALESCSTTEKKTEPYYVAKPESSFSKAQQTDFPPTVPNSICCSPSQHTRMHSC